MNRNPEHERGDRPARGAEACPEVRDRLPLFTAQRLDLSRAEAVEAHLGDCEACAAEAALVRRLQEVRVEPPAGLVDQVLYRILGPAAVPSTTPGAATKSDEPGGVLRFPAWPFGPVRRAVAGWGLPAAAVLVLALGIGVFWTADRDLPGDLLLTAFVEEADERAHEEWLVAGAPVWEALSDDVLISLLEEYE